MSVLTSAILTRFEAVVEGTAGSPRRGFRKAGTRFRFDREPEGGRDGTYRCEVLGIQGARQVFGTGEAVRYADTVQVQVAYFRGGGDTAIVGRRVVNDIFALVRSCESELTYDSQVTGIRVVRWAGFSRLADLPRAEIWGVNFQVEWQAVVVTS